MELKKEEVIFRDGSTLIVTEATWRTSMELTALEEQAAKSPLENPTDQMFHLLIYPKLAACSSGAVPTEEEALALPVEELNKWYEAANRMNPYWFEVQKPDETPEVRLKKKGKKPTASTSG